ncbi:energy-coupling factor transporter transmembrane component T family protein [Amnibacterium endophyticum]|uniref:Energy-coupling factor transporter transmembrane component T family protein n=1 Tax=Amnibacterium endophyticum TaxID=2109337 RepID=A0ABW4LJ53_9MICO
MIAAANPVTRFAVAIGFAVVLVISVDPVSAGTALLLGAVLLPLAGARVRPAAAVPILVAAPLAALTIALYGAGGGRVLVQAGFVQVSEGSLVLALATLLRVLAIGLVGLGLLGAIDATRLADGLAQLLHLPSRFVLGALAAFRLLGLLGEDWRALALARRARGVADRGRIRRFAGQAFALLVLSVRRGTVLATAMEARGFGGPGGRTWARPSRLGAPDAVLVAAAVVVLGVAVAAAVLAGTWHPGSVR